MPDLAPEILHAHLLDRAPRILRFDADAYFPEWQSAVRRSFKQLLGLMPARVPPQLQILSDAHLPAPLPHRAIRFLFTSEPRVQVPCTLLLPDNSPAPFSTLICLQDNNPRPIAPGSPGVALLQHQALAKGYATILMDMRGSGERTEISQTDRAHASLVALLLGRTMMGENVCDITRLIDVLTEHFPQVVPARIAICGNAAAGAAAYYAAAVEPRIAAVVVAGAISSYASSLGTMDHTADHYLPNILHYFDMSDLAGVIVPRPLLILAGESDPLTPIAGVRECYSEIEEIYASQQAPSACRLITHPGNDPHFETLLPALDQLWHQRPATEPIR